MHVTDRPSPDAPSLTQANNRANGLFEESRRQMVYSRSTIDIYSEVLAFPSMQLMQPELCQFLVLSGFACFRTSATMGHSTGKGRKRLGSEFPRRPYTLVIATRVMPVFDKIRDLSMLVFDDGYNPIGRKGLHTRACTF